ncbi:MAG: methionine--tRNA ligase [bacterium]|nr:methionine--tRNA ligase [bacterium]
MDRKFYITSPIYYVNDKPHVGHAYSTIIADTLARYHRALGDEVTFLTGTDENSQKTVDAARKSGEDIISYTDRLAGVWKSVWQALNISNTDFIRTTEARHKKMVEEFWKRLWDNGDIYKGRYEGLYCKGHEAFMKESDLVNGLCPDHKTKPEHFAEDNYFFRLKRYEKDLSAFYEKNPNFVIPENRYNEVKNFVSEGLEDLSISRQVQKWGIPVPNDPSQVVYVWFDALINYVSAIGIEQWEQHPADVHVIGKDITRFHAIIWPAMLMSAKLPLPKQVAANGFFTVNGVKISKSLGNAIDPIGLAEKYGAEALRYFLLREIPYGEDGDFSEEKLKERYNADLANGLGNLLSRIMKMAAMANIVVPAWDAAKLVKANPRIPRFMEEYQLDNVIEHIWEKISQADAMIEEKKPFKILKTDRAKAEKDIILLLKQLKEIAVMLEPFMPETSEKILEAIKTNSEIKVPLFPRKQT